MPDHLYTCFLCMTSLRSEKKEPDVTELRRLDQRNSIEKHLGQYQEMKYSKCLHAQPITKHNLIHFSQIQ
jgi:hypothetical protein